MSLVRKAIVTVAYPELGLKRVSWIPKIANVSGWWRSVPVTVSPPPMIKKLMTGGGVSRQPETPPWIRHWVRQHLEYYTQVWSSSKYMLNTLERIEIAITLQNTSPLCKIKSFVVEQKTVEPLWTTKFPLRYQAYASHKRLCTWFISYNWYYHIYIIQNGLTISWLLYIDGINCTWESL